MQIASTNTTQQLVPKTGYGALHNKFQLAPHYFISTSRTYGMVMPGRSISSSSYRYGFNGMEKDDELKEDGNSYDFGARLYDPRIGRWLSVDPLFFKNVGNSDYCMGNNSPIFLVDKSGLDALAYLRTDNNGNQTLIIKATYVSGATISQAAQNRVHALLNSGGQVDYNGQRVNVKFEISFEQSMNLSELNEREDFEMIMPSSGNIQGTDYKNGVNLLNLKTEDVSKTGEGSKKSIAINYELIGGDIDGIASTLVHEIGHNIGFLHSDGGIMKDQVKGEEGYRANTMTNAGLQNYVNRIPKMTEEGQQYWKNKPVEPATDGSPGITTLNTE